MKCSITPGKVSHQYPTDVAIQRWNLSKSTFAKLTSFVRKTGGYIYGFLNFKCGHLHHVIRMSMELNDNIMDLKGSIEEVLVIITSEMCLQVRSACGAFVAIRLGGRPTDGMSKRCTTKIDEVMWIFLSRYLFMKHPNLFIVIDQYVQCRVTWKHWNVRLTRRVAWHDNIVCWTLFQSTLSRNGLLPCRQIHHFLPLY